MEYSNLENDNNNYKEELILAFVSDISPLVFSNIITDDNLILTEVWISSL